MTIKRWRGVAEAAQAVLVLGLPFVTVRGESALRFDVPTLRLHAFGATIWIDELFVVLAGFLAVIFAFLLVTLLLGRLACGWACPQTALLDLTAFLDRARRRGGWSLGASYLGVAVGSLLVSANLLWYFVSPAEFFRAAGGFSLHPVVNGAWLVTAALVFADLALWRHRFCATICPYARFQGALLDRHSMAIAYDTRRSAECIDCRACVRACPVGIDIRDGLQAACTSCAACIDACAPIMARLRRAPKLVGYFFGAPGTALRWARPGVVALALLAAAAIGLTVAVAAGRADLEVTVTSSGDARPLRIGPDGVLHRVGATLENRGRAPLRVALSVRVAGAEVAVAPGDVTLRTGEHRKLTLLFTTSGAAAQKPLDATLVARAGEGAGAERMLHLPAPEASR